jgi:hypothetical protein
VLVCHRTHSKKHPFVTIRVAPSAVRAHLRHGDMRGRCTVAKIKKMKAAANRHGKKGKKGK